jgi:hypothetical protein
MTHLISLASESLDDKLYIYKTDQIYTLSFRFTVTLKSGKTKSATKTIDSQELLVLALSIKRYLKSINFVHSMDLKDKPPFQCIINRYLSIFIDIAHNQATCTFQDIRDGEPYTKVYGGLEVAHEDAAFEFLLILNQMCSELLLERRKRDAMANRRPYADKELLEKENGN